MRQIFFDVEQFETWIGHIEDRDGRLVMTASEFERGILTEGPYPVLREGLYEVEVDLIVDPQKAPRLRTLEKWGHLKIMSDSETVHAVHDLPTQSEGEQQLSFQVQLPADTGYNFIVIKGFQPCAVSAIKLKLLSPDVQVGPDGLKIMQISLPRSGTHWLYRMISTIVGWPVVDDGSNLTEDPHQRLLTGSNIPRYMITHERAASLPIFDPSWKMIFLTRDFRDAIASHYLFWTAIQERDIHLLSKSEALDRLIEEFGRSERLNRRFYTHNKPDALVIYEDLLADPAGELKRILDSLSIPYTEQDIELAVERYSFKNVTGRERGDEDPTAHARKGVTGDWRFHLEDNHLARIEELLDGEFVFQPRPVEPDSSSRDDANEPIIS